MTDGESSLLGAGDLVAFVSATDPDRARRFYEETLGLRLVEQTPIACVFDANGTTLRVTTAERLEPAPYTVLGWNVPDIAGTVRELSGRGVELVQYDTMEQDEVGVWTAPSGARVAWFHDPDGNLLSVTQPG